MEESIYNLIPTPQFVPKKPPLYSSTHEGRVEPKQFELGVRTKKGHATFGKPNGAFQPKPNSYTKAHGKEPILPEPTRPTNRKEKSKPPVPTTKDKPIMGLCSEKNFITTNAVENILSKPQKVPLEEPRFTQRKTFGKVPTYLKQIKARISQENEYVRQYIEQRDMQGSQTTAQQMPEEERRELLDHLKTKWQEVNSAYQTKMSFVLDTPAKKMRKESLERQLAEIEKDIELLSRGSTVVIVTDF
uniref:Enkurin n=1 Tax=Tetraselmis sp. GSL018 TaxID=582737 RepID=A0A061SKA3_9CHLO|mmetsp:Transcript_14798/g.35252  ORF Transcript_14798/g.35252 Transcript_14798/m.35252 type:complete len:245 (+) Transcript_14798:1217-1951(+)|eukprot:CAMPEP_0177584846 /NCGR_PEP_ID=MMETSP0419_2-20121207/4142_1 /TAXON_ID=582737 /ORGANISM="Tetraselmis sp., Strain GSL018" /LENGTH=244 /DNA_ID=CAMNT_0019074469 /DNA_START=2526 /DNA_END=3260 /DNA_ORIENTATION=-